MLVIFYICTANERAYDTWTTEGHWTLGSNAIMLLRTYLEIHSQVLNDTDCDARFVDCDARFELDCEPKRTKTLALAVTDSLYPPGEHGDCSR